MDLAKEETYAGHWARSQKSPQIKNTPTLAFPPWQKVARRCSHGEGGIWSRKAPSQNKRKQKNQQKQPDSFPVPRAALSRLPSAPARGLGGAQSGRGRGGGGWALGTPNQQPAPAVAPVTSEALPPPHCGRTPGAASHPSSRLRRGGALGAWGDSARAQPLTRGRRGRGAGTRMRAPGAVAGGGGGSSSIGDPKAERQAGGRCRGTAPLPRRASPR